jgi:hypothetical protein
MMTSRSESLDEEGLVDMDPHRYLLTGDTPFSDVFPTGLACLKHVDSGGNAMALVLDCPERLLRIRVKNISIAESCTWEGITISRESQGQYRITGYRQHRKIGSGTMRLEKIINAVVQAALALHEQHLQTVAQIPATQSVPAASIRKRRKALIHPAQLPLWSLT